MPNRLRGEGLFSYSASPAKCAVKDRKQKQDKNAKSTPQLTSAKSWLTDEAAAEMEIYAGEDRINAFPGLHADTPKNKKERFLDVIHRRNTYGHAKAATSSLRNHWHYHHVCVKMPSLQ